MFGYWLFEIESGYRRAKQNRKLFAFYLEFIFWLIIAAGVGALTVFVVIR